MKRFVFVLIVAVVACSKPVEKIKRRVADALDVGTPLGKPDDVRAREKERFDQAWRQLKSFRAQQALQRQQQQAAAAAQAPQPIQFVSGVKESFKNLGANRINTAPVNVPITGDVKGPSVLRTQVYLDRAHFSVGVIDGRWGRNSAIAVWLWQRQHGLEATGDVDEATFRSLAAAAENVPPVVSYTLAADDVTGPFVSIPEYVYEKQHLSCLCYETLREKLA